MKLRSRVQLRKDHVNEIVSCAMLATTRDILFIELRWWKTDTIPNACAQRSLKVECQPVAARRSWTLRT
jgi:hypothetical protein